MNSGIVTLLVINYGSKRLNVNINIRNGYINLTDSFLILHLLKTKITMAFAHKYFVMFLLLSIVTQGHCRCRSTDLQIGGVRTGRYIAAQPEWKVTVVNTCNCPQKQVILTCEGFAPVNPVKPWLLRPQGKACLLINGEVMPAGATVEFAYAGEPYIFRPVSSRVKISCMN
ncbi:uncharacterized protein LOC125580574 [Brassica napus]|nr:uncharacterized protein LOC125580574 [Brassica napus]